MLFAFLSLADFKLFQNNAFAVYSPFAKGVSVWTGYFLPFFLFLVFLF
jgi:hypothetical protein